MKTIMMYQCEKCRKVYDSASQAMTCEAAHYGLTLEEYYHWMELLKIVKEAGVMNSIWNMQLISKKRCHVLLLWKQMIYAKLFRT